MLALTQTSSVPTRIGALRASAMRSATRSAISVVPPVSSSSANSSPPNRATVSPGRADALSRSPTTTSSWSPTGWPRLSFTTLKSSRSRNSTATGPSSRSARSSAWETRSRNSARLANPVSESWNACRRSCRSRRRRSVTSRLLRTMAPTSGSSRRLVIVVSTSRHSPSARRTRHSRLAGVVRPPSSTFANWTRTAARSSGWIKTIKGRPTTSSGSYQSIVRTPGL